MKKTLLKPKTILASGILSIGLIFGLSLVNHNLGAKQASVHKANSGVGICFQRVTQTFTALMIGDFKSSYLGKNFRNITSECLGEVTKALSSLDVQSNVMKVSNNLKSDLHWFDQKVDKVSEMAVKGEIDISQSNVTNKYYELEALKTTLEESLIGKVEGIDGNRDLTSLGIMMALLSLILSGVAFFFSQKIRRNELDAVEDIAGEKLLNNEVDDAVTDLTYEVFSLLNLPNTKNIIETYCSNLVRENRALEQSLIQMNTLGYEKENEERVNIELEEPTREIADFNASFNTVLDKMQEKVFNHGIMLDTDLNDNFSIYASNEDLEQLLFSLFSYSVDCSAKSEGNKKVTIRSKSLGGIAYCKVKVANYSFDEQEMGVLNGKEPSSDTSVNLLLLRELLRDLNASIAVRNKQNSESQTVESEMEIIFDRARETVLNEESKASVNIVKGSKQDIKRYFEENLSRIN